MITVRIDSATFSSKLHTKVQLLPYRKHTNCLLLKNQSG